jgi:plastocyanin
MTARSGRWAGVLRSVLGNGLVPILAAGVFLALGAPAAVRAEEHAIAITDDGLVPAEVTVVVGELVTWTNHTSLTREVLTPDHELNSGPVGPGQNSGHVFEEPGNWIYFVTGDPRMQGTVHVKAMPELASGGSPEMTAPPGTSPPGFSPVAPSAVPSSESPTQMVLAAPAPSAVTATPSGVGGNGPALFLAVAVVGFIAVAASLAGLIGASRRPGR